MRCKEFLNCSVCFLFNHSNMLILLSCIHMENDTNKNYWIRNQIQLDNHWSVYKLLERVVLKKRLKSCLSYYSSSWSYRLRKYSKWSKIYRFAMRLDSVWSSSNLKHLICHKRLLCDWWQWLNWRQYFYKSHIRSLNKERLHTYKLNCHCTPR